jgi:hypothetical protein
MEEGGCIVRELGCRIRVQLKIQETWTGYPWGKKGLERKCMNPSNESALHHNGNWDRRELKLYSGGFGLVFSGNGASVRLVLLGDCSGKRSDRIWIE